MADKETFLIGCPICGDIYRWGPDDVTANDGKNWKCLGKLSKEEMVARALQGRVGMYGWACYDCQKKRSAASSKEISQ